MHVFHIIHLSSVRYEIIGEDLHVERSNRRIGATGGVALDYLQTDRGQVTLSGLFSAHNRIIGGVLGETVSSHSEGQ